MIRTGILQEDPRLRDTPGFSFAFLPDRDVVYLQSADDDRAHYVRVIPGWVKQMRKAVDAANR